MKKIIFMLFFIGNKVGFCWSNKKYTLYWNYYHKSSDTLMWKVRWFPSRFFNNWVNNKKKWINRCWWKRSWYMMYHLINQRSILAKPMFIDSSSIDEAAVVRLFRWGISWFPIIHARIHHTSKKGRWSRVLWLYSYYQHAGSSSDYKPLIAYYMPKLPFQQIII